MAQASTLSPPARVARMIDIAGLLRQASTPVNVDQLLRNGKKSIHLISREKIDALISRAIRDVVEKHRAAGGSPPPIQMEAEAKRGFADLLSQHQQTEKAGDDLARSRLELDKDLQDMRDDLTHSIRKGKKN